MTRDLLVRLYNDLNTLDQERISVVTYEDGVLTYRQRGKVIQLPYINLYFFPPKKRFKYGVLTQSGLQRLLVDILHIIQDSKLDNNGLLFSPKDLGTIVYTLVENPNLRGPQVLYELNYINIKNRFYSWFLLNNSNAETRLLLKHIKNK